MEVMLEFLEEISAELENINSILVSSALEKIHNKITKIHLKLREERGWGSVNKLIKTAPYCPHKEQIIIARYCPRCKRISHGNDCNACTTQEDMENDLEIYGYDPHYVYFVKKRCEVRCQVKAEHETWILPRCTCAARRKRAVLRNSHHLKKRTTNV